MSHFNEQQPTISARHLGKRYQYLWALSKVSFDIYQGEIIGIIGPNGAGKSTLLNIIATILTPTTGELYIANQNVKHKSEQIRNNIGLISYNSFLYDNLTARENLIFWASLHQKKPWMFEQLTIHEYISKFAKEFAFEYWLERPVRELSTGMRKKVDFIRVLLSKPGIILLDEPFSGLDSKNSHQFITKIKEMAITGTILIASHDLAILTKLCTRVLLLKKGILGKIYSREELTLENLEEAQK
jgi:ABC-type multidrug transport system ATPase subunit